MSEGYTYQFLALRGVQAGREYFVGMCPLKLIPRIFLFNEDELPAELRAQRILNRARVPEITRYLLNNPTDYVFSSITASVDGEVDFAPLALHGHGRNAGLLTIPMSSRFLINDGQHRRAAIEEALHQNPRMGDETISVVFFVDAGLRRSQQLFSDLNTHAVRPTRSIGILYDHRDPMAQLTLSLIRKAPIFDGLTEVEKTTISNRSTKLFTLSGVFQATQAFLGRKATAATQESDLVDALAYWTLLGNLIPEWKLAIKREASAANLRRDFIHSHGVTLHALGHVGNAVLGSNQNSWMKRLRPLEKIDWRRSNMVWEGRALIRGHMSKASESVLLTACMIKQVLGLPLNDEESRLEISMTDLRKRQI